MLVVNAFNAAHCRPARADVARLTETLSGCGFSQLYTLGVATQEESVVVVAHRAPPQLRRPGRRDLQRAARSAWGASARLPGREGAWLVRRLLWVQSDDHSRSDDVADVCERRPPATNLDRSRASPRLASLKQESSACPEWMDWMES